MAPRFCFSLCLIPIAQGPKHATAQAWARGRTALWAVTAALALAACGGGAGGSGSSGVSSTSSSTPVAIYPQPVVPSALSAALVSGDASALNDPTAIALQTRYVLQQTSLSQESRVGALWNGVSLEYNPKDYSHFVSPTNPELAQPYIVGDHAHNNALASISVAWGGRSAGYGANVLGQFDNNENLNHRPAFKRLVAWLVQGNPDMALPSPLPVAWAGIDVPDSVNGMAKAGIATSTVACNFTSNTACASAAKLLVVGGGVTAGSLLESNIRTLIQSGKPVLYLHTDGWGASAAGSQILAAMKLQLGDYGGNFWDKDLVSAARSPAGNASKTAQFSGLASLVNALATDSLTLNYDWSKCNGNDCSKATGLETGLLDPVDTLRSQIDAFNRTGSNLFTTPNTQLLRLLVLWGDTVRKQVRYPLDKVGNPAAFGKALVADALVSYVRPQSTAQAELGTFARNSSSSLPVSVSDEVLDVLIPATSGFTAIGRFAVPGKTLSLEVLDAGSASVALRLNTQRTGSTRLWENNKFNRPRFLASPNITLEPNTPISISTPYGGTMQLVFNEATAGQTVRLRVRGVAKHPFLDLSTGAGDKPGFVAALNAAQFDWAEIKLAGIEVHSRADKLRKVVNDDYGNDMDRYIQEMKTIFFEDLYMLAGYAMPGKSLSAHVQAMCTALAWDCTNLNLHRVPGTQHINVDAYSQCGNGCSGNPYDQDWGLNPRGWGESHEVGHNQQRGILQVHSGRSAEVSNNLFPLHKNWRLYKELGDNRSSNAVAYRSAFDMIKAAKQEANPSDGAYQRIWGNDAYAVQNGERMAFYMQWVHYWAQRQADEAKGWDIVTLLYLHQRQFSGTSGADWAANKTKLGYSQYASRPDVSGNDNLLIALSWITQRDQRATFDLWGVSYSAAAADQVASYSFAAEPALFYANTSTNNHATVRKVNMDVPSPVWPF
ncbi:ImpA family metalloprotease [Rhodoferax aquaticus]|uniref:Peptidase M60 domain-containing protein n=1 Tax=Rhodoferax aquaticus TaxID=2527691 RepID=A0A515EMW6_9BURK|nr:ImpA family metalloprotease [Rhodoferax aquaticus]QDL54015.1 hypothetical protein EXZ61_07430 [Rhodoferax aquaticus]